MIYKITEKYPDTEKYGLAQQMRRAVVSIASNIAEGSARHSRKERVQFYYISRGSISELDTQIEISNQIGFMNDQDKDNLSNALNEISYMLNGLIESQKRKL